MSSIVSTSRIAIVGLGQLGSSLAMAFMEKGCINLLAYARKPEVLQEAVNAKIIDAGSTDPSDILPVVDICFICLPLDATVSFVKDNIKYFRPGSIITDVGSVKGSIVSEIRDLLNEKGCYFIGSHPMAGTEKTGFHAGDVTYFLAGGGCPGFRT